MPIKTILAVSLAATSLVSPAALAGSPCFVAGDALGMELHYAAVLALATPEVDPLDFEPFETRLTEVSMGAFEDHVERIKAPSSIAWTVPVVEPTITAADGPSTKIVLAALLHWFRLDATATCWMAVVN
jgi:hypothetical protein